VTRRKICSSGERGERADCFGLYCITKASVDSRGHAHFGGDGGRCFDIERSELGKRKFIYRPLQNGKSRRQQSRKWERTDTHSGAGVEDILRFIFHFSIV